MTELNELYSHPDGTQMTDTELKAFEDHLKVCDFCGNSEIANDGTLRIRLDDDGCWICEVCEESGFR